MDNKIKIFPLNKGNLTPLIKNEFLKTLLKLKIKKSKAKF